MKKILITLGFLTLFSMYSFSLGIGASLTLPIADSGVNPGVMATIKPSSNSLVYGMGLAIKPNYFRLGLTGDLWLAKGKLIDFLNFYMGPGLYAGMTVIGSSSNIDLGVRLPVGINAYLLKNSIELFIEIAPALGLDLNPVTFPILSAQGSFGFRFWFE
jgi:hypothetical protein